MYLFIFVVLLLYVLVIGLLIYGFDKVEVYNLNDSPRKIRFSIVVPFRNESQHLPNLLNSLKSLDYPTSHVEILLIDDASEDNSREIIEEFQKTSSLNLKVLENERKSGSPKKDAIEKAVSCAKNDWIVTTDADCKVPPFWLESLNSFINDHGFRFIISPITITKSNTLLDRFQAMETLILQAISFGSYGLKYPLLCNGANLAYEKSLFIEVGGYEGNNDVASGDDMFLLQKVMDRDKTGIGLLKSNKAVVTTHPEPHFSSLLSQKKRWVKKMGVRSNWLSFALGVIIVVMNFTLITLFVFSLFEPSYLKTLGQISLVKFGIDFLLLFKSARFFKKENLLFSFWWVSLVYPFYLFIVLFSSYFGPYRWKGRNFSY